MKSNDLKERVSHNLKRLRKSAHLSQFQLAELACISEHTVNSIESRRMWASDETLRKICDALKIDACRLFLPVADSVSVEAYIRAELQHSMTMCVKDIFCKIFRQTE